MDIITLLMQIIVLIFSVIVHEVSHGYVALLLGDPTARDAGRLTLNPLPHIDWFMSILLPAFLIFTNAGFVIGGAKPVPINPSYFKDHKKGNMLTSLAGPASNLLLMIICTLLLKLIYVVPALYSPGLKNFLIIGISMNMTLAAFNLIPIPPLDGSGVLAFFLPGELAWRYLSIGPYGMLILMILMGTNLLGLIMRPFLAAAYWIIHLIL